MHNKNVVIFGFGSSGKRFAKIFYKKGFRVYIFQHRSFSIPRQYFPIENLENLEKFLCAVVASPTNSHYKYLRSLIDANVPVFVEKPLSHNYSDAKKIFHAAKKRGLILQVGFNLRYLPIVIRIEKYIKEKRLGNLLFVDFYAGQYLPLWREDHDYRKSYSASWSKGGGVSLDLIHEIDIACSWFGSMELNQIFSKKLSRLKVDTEDFVQFFSNTKPVVRITLDYLNFIKSRRYMLLGDKGSIECDIVTKKFVYKSESDEEQTLTDLKLFDIDSTYLYEVDDFIKKINNKKKFDLTERELGIDSLKIALKARRHV